MSRSLFLVGFALVASLGVAACHSNGPPGGSQMPDPMDPMNPMYRTHSAATACTPQAPAATCSPVESR